MLLWAAASPDEKRSDLNIGDLATRGKVGLMPNKDPTGIGIAGEQPPISIGSTAVNLSHPKGHADAPVLPNSIQTQKSKRDAGVKCPWIPTKTAFTLGRAA